jgi:hypothetical protein
MGKKTFLGVLNKSRKKQLDERRQEKTLKMSQGDSMSQKEDPKPTESYNGGDLPVRCLGHTCEYVSYKDVDGMTALWCSKTKKTVYNMKSCPFERWYKDEKGWPHDN